MDLSATVILCTRNRLHDVNSFLDSLSKQIYQPKEIIIVDSSDKSLSKNSSFKQLFNQEQFNKSELKYIESAPGLTYQRNLGIKAASGDIIYFFDDDVILASNYLFEMQKAFGQHKEYAAGMGDISNITKQSSLFYRFLRKIFLLPHEMGSGNFSWSGMPTHPYGLKKFKKIEVLGGCCMAFRSNLFDSFEFDEKLAGYCYLEDADIAKRISQKHPIFFNPAAQLAHNESPLARDRVSTNAQMFVRNYTYLFFKNFYPSNKLLFLGYVWSLCGLFIQAIIYRNWGQLKGYSAAIVAMTKNRRIL